MARRPESAEISVALMKIALPDTLTMGTCRRLGRIGNRRQFRNWEADQQCLGLGWFLSFSFFLNEKGFKGGKETGSRIECVWANS